MKTRTRASAAKSTAKVAKKKSPIKKNAGARSKVGKPAVRVARGMECFWVNNGPVLADIFELERALEQMTDEQFKHHVNGDRNDFALWVEQILLDQPRARALARAKTRTAARRAIRATVKRKK